MCTLHRATPRRCRIPWRTRYSISGRLNRAARKLPRAEYVDTTARTVLKRVLERDTNVDILDCSVLFYSDLFRRTCAKSIRSIVCGSDSLVVLATFHLKLFGREKMLARGAKKSTLRKKKKRKILSQYYLPQTCRNRVRTPLEVDFLENLRRWLLTMNSVPLEGPSGDLSIDCFFDRVMYPTLEIDSRVRKKVVFFCFF